MKRMLTVLGLVVWSLSAPSGPSWAAEKEEYKALAYHGSIGLAYVEQWTAQSSPAFAELKPALLADLYLGSRYGPKGLTLGGQLLWDVRRIDKGRQGHVALKFEF